MISPVVDPDFSHLLSAPDAKRLLKRLQALDNNKPNDRVKVKPQLKALAEQWQQSIHAQHINTSDDKLSKNAQSANIFNDKNEEAATDWLINLFNTLFADQEVILVRGAGEPEYFPAKDNQPARIEFAHGFFQSALHELHTPLYRLTCYKPLILIMYITTLLLS